MRQLLQVCAVLYRAHDIRHYTGNIVRELAKASTIASSPCGGIYNDGGISQSSMQRPYAVVWEYIYHQYDKFRDMVLLLGIAPSSSSSSSSSSTGPSSGNTSSLATGLVCY